MLIPLKLWTSTHLHKFWCECWYPSHHLLWIRWGCDSWDAIWYPYSPLMDRTNWAKVRTNQGFFFVVRVYRLTFLAYPTIPCCIECLPSSSMKYVETLPMYNLIPVRLTLQNNYDQEYLLERSRQRRYDGSELRDLIGSMRGRRRRPRVHSIYSLF